MLYDQLLSSEPNFGVDDGTERRQRRMGTSVWCCMAASDAALGTDDRRASDGTGGTVVVMDVSQRRDSARPLHAWIQRTVLRRRARRRDLI